MKELRSAIEIGAPAEVVWAILADFAGYPQWNPFIRQARGKLSPGERLEVRLQPPGSRGMTLHPTVMAVEPAHELRWAGHLFVPGLFDGEHSFTIEPLGTGRVRFTQREIFTGLLVPLLSRMLDNGTRRGFEEMNAALRDRAERIVPGTEQGDPSGLRQKIPP